MQLKLRLVVKKGGIRLLRNLKRALDNKGVTLRAYASILGVSEKTIWNKINEETPFTYPEVRKTKMEILPEYDSDYLFKTDGIESAQEPEKEVV